MPDLGSFISQDRETQTIVTLGDPQDVDRLISTHKAHTRIEQQALKATI